MLDLMSLQPHQVSRDLRGYSVLFFGDPKSGKTTIATKFPKHLLLATEKGYSAIPGAMALPINKWSDIRKAVKQLSQDDVKEKFSTIVIDTADLAYEMCEKYICNVNGVETIGKIPFGQGYNMVAKEFDEVLRSVVQMNYGLVLISHSQDKTFTSESGEEYNQIVPTLSNKARLVCQRLCDIIGYSRAVETADGLQTRLFMRGTPRFVAGARFKYIPDSIEFTYKALVDAIGQAIDKQEQEDGSELFTNEYSNVNAGYEVIDFDKVMGDFNSIVSEKMEENSEYYAPRITEIIERHLGKGRKVSDCSRDQAEIVDLIVYELKDLK